MYIKTGGIKLKPLIQMYILPRGKLYIETGGINCLVFVVFCVIILVLGVIDQVHFSYTLTRA